MIWRMAWRNLRRNARRSILTIGSIAFGLLIAATFISIAHGSYGQIIDGAARMNAGHVTIEPRGYRDAPSLDLVLPDATRLAADAAARPEVARVNVRVLGQAMAATAAGSAGAFFFAVDPAAEKGVLYILDHVKEGTALSGRDGREAIVGRKMAEQLDLKIGSKLVLTLSDRRGEVVSGLLRVKGIFETSVALVDAAFIVVPIDWARALAGFAPAEATQVAVQLRERRAAGPIATALDRVAAAQGGTALTWEETMPDLAATILMDKSSNYVMQIIIFILIGAGILNTVLMSVLERFREFGVMLAVGTTPARLGLLVAAETLCLAVAGTLAGVAVSAPVYWYFNTRGIDMRIFMKENLTLGNIVYDTQIYAHMYPDTMAMVLGLVFALIMAAGVYPAYVATRVRPLDALRSL